MIEPDVTSVIDGFYAAAAGDATWAKALINLKALLNFSGAAIRVYDRTRSRTIERVWIGIDERAWPAYAAHYNAINPWDHYIRDHPESRITYTYLHTPESAIDRHEYFTWKMLETGLRYSLTARTRPDAPFDAQVPLHRSRKAGHPSQHEITTFAHIFPHIERALRLAWQLNTAPLASAAADHVLDGIAHGVVLLDRRGHVVFANRAARDMAARADGFALSGDGIRGLHPFNDGMLQRLIASAIQPDGTNPFKRGGALRLPRRFDKRDYAILVAPLAPRTGLFAGLAPAACVTIADPAEPVAPLGTLRDLYGLTPAELRLAEHLARGNTPREAAAASGLAVSTVREQLAALLRKTGTARQADLVGLIRTIASARPPGP